jgi:dihydroneopterin aldolase
METLTLKGLRFRAYHGYYDEERQEGNDFEVDLTFSADLRKAGDNDNLEDTIDYQEAAEIVKSVMDGPSLKLIEALTKRIGDQLFEVFPEAQKLEVAVRKLHPPLETETDYSEIRMSWQR